MLSNRGSCRVQNLGRRADLWMRNCSQKHTLLPSFPEQESSVQTIGMNQRVFNFSLRRLPRTEQQVKAFLSSSSVSSSISLIPSPSPLEWSSDSEESTAAMWQAWGYRLEISSWFFGLLFSMCPWVGLLSYQPHSESAPVNGQPGMNMQFDASGVPKGILLKIKMHRSLLFTQGTYP